MIQRLESEITWAKYAAVYDSLLLNFPAYCQLLQQVSNAVNGYLQCADLGTGTGNSAIQLLEDEPERSVVAVDSNEFMLRRFLSKAGDRFSRRLQIRQDDVEYMPFFGDQSLDAVVMVNTLYAVNAPSVCLREVHRILRPNGRLLLTTPHSETNVNHLLTELRRSLSDQGLFEKYSDAFRVAEERHRALSEQIHRFSLEQTVSIVEDCGFEIESCAITYVNSVIILAARRR